MCVVVQYNVHIHVPLTLSPWIWVCKYIHYWCIHGLCCCWISISVGNIKTILNCQATIMWSIQSMPITSVRRSWPMQNCEGFPICAVIGKRFFGNGPFSAFFNDFEIFNGPFLIILLGLWWAISQVNGTMAHGPLPSKSSLYVMIELLKMTDVS